VPPPGRMQSFLPSHLSSLKHGQTGYRVSVMTGRTFWTMDSSGQSTQASSLTCLNVASTPAGHEDSY
jgi:hypothetical protein